MAIRTSESLAYWRDLGAGKMSIIDSYDRAGRRYLVLRRAGTEARLTERQRLVMAYRAYCQTLATIADELDVSVPTIANELSAGLEKLGLECDTDLPRVFGMGLKLLPANGGKRQGRSLSRRKLRREVEVSPLSAPPGIQAVRAAYRGKPAVVVSFPVPTVDWSRSLTSAEKDVANDLLAGLPNDAIGRKRGSSVRTVVNQVASIFKKVGAHSRLELCLVVYTNRSPPGPTDAKRRRSGGSPRSGPASRTRRRP
jgi:DNA-binding NarL/FixJ family response regulator